MKTAVATLVPVILVSFAPRMAAADRPIGMNGVDFRLVGMNTERTGGPDAPAGTWVGVDMGLHYSLIDRVRGGDSAVRVGDYLQVGFGVGYGSADSGDAADNFWFSLQLGAGLQAAVRVGEEIDVGVRFYGDLRLEPFSYVGINGDVFARFKQAIGQITYGRLDSRAPAPVGGGTPSGDLLQRFALSGRWLLDEQRFLGVELGRKQGSNAGGVATEWSFAILFGAAVP